MTPHSRQNPDKFQGFPHLASPSSSGGSGSSGPVTPRPPDFRGQRIGKFEVLERLAVGGMAELFLAFTSGRGGFRKFVAVKRILPSVQGDEDFVKMFLDEARVTASLNHVNIGHVFDLGDEDDGLYLAMEFIAGQNLNQIQKAQLKRKASLPVGFCGAVARDLCAALHYAHTFTDPSGRPLPVIHRDVAQKNIMVAFDGVTKLLDFGIAKSHGNLGKTSIGRVKGTAGYMSPEQVQGHALDGRSDIFSLGVVLHELLTGRRLFSGATEEEEMRKILTAEIPSPHQLSSHIPESLSDVVLKALARDRNERFATAKEMERAIEAALGGAIYDEEQVAAFMRHLFHEKMEAIRALLDSAGDPTSSADTRSLAKTFLDSPVPYRTPSGSAPKPVAEPARRTPPPLPKARAPAPVTVGPPRVRMAVEFPALTSLNRPGISRSHWKTWVPAIAVAALFVGGLIALALHENPALFQTSPKPSPSPVTPTPPPKDIKAVPEDSKADPSEAPEPDAAPVHRAPHAKTGTVTLIITPAAQVRLNRHFLGTTPLFNLPLPVGLLTLELEGTDGQTRLLRVNVHAGRNEVQRFDLQDLPAK